jgi:pyruvate/2-oxoglutarate dehydrogenase complex dihydrolipoamide dehydrogenase (E3) component
VPSFAPRPGAAQPGDVHLRGRLLTARAQLPDHASNCSSRCSGYEHIVIATGASPFIAPVPGLHELGGAGVWTYREVTGMKAVPRRLVVLGGGPVGVEIAQAVRRLGGEVVLSARDRHVLSREPAPLGEALGEVLRREPFPTFSEIYVAALKAVHDKITAERRQPVAR